MYIHDMICKLDAKPETHLYGELVSTLGSNEEDKLSDIEARKSDIKIFTNNKIRKLYMSKNDPNSINKFEFVLVNYNHNHKVAVSKEKIIKSYNLLKKEEGITRIIFQGNWAINFYPFTRWILAHRTYHAMHVTFGKEIESFNDTVIQFINLISEVTGWKYSIESLNRDKNTVKYGNLDGYSEMIETVRSVFKFRSAKHSDRLIDLDLFAELFAQYQITGSISFNKTDNDDINNIIEKYTPILNERVIAVCHQMNNGEFIF